MLLMLLFSFHKHLTGVEGGHVSGLIFACLPTLFAISVTQFFGNRLHHVLNIKRDLRHGRVLSLGQFIGNYISK